MRTPSAAALSFLVSLGRTAAKHIPIAPTREEWSEHCYTDLSNWTTRKAAIRELHDATPMLVSLSYRVSPRGDTGKARPPTGATLTHAGAALAAILACAEAYATRQHGTPRGDRGYVALATPIAEAKRSIPRHGAGMTASGYTCNAGAPTSILVRLQGEKIWRRVMCWQFSNAGTCFLRIGGVPHLISDCDIPAIPGEAR